MKEPTCNLPAYQNFKISQKDSRTYAINQVFCELELNDWTDLNSLIALDAKSFAGEQSLKKYKDSLHKISQSLTRYPFVQGYAEQVRNYLQSLPVEREYLKKFEEKLDKRAKRRSKRKLNTQTQLNSEAEVLLAKKRKLLQIHKAIKDIDSLLESSSASAAGPSNTAGAGNSAGTASAAHTVDIDNLTGTTDLIFASHASSFRSSEIVSMRNVIYNAAVVTHQKYQERGKICLPWN